MDGQLARELVRIAKGLLSASEEDDAREHIKEACEEALKAVRRGGDMERPLKELLRAAEHGLKVLV